MVYLDTSILLRWLLDEPAPLDPRGIEDPVTSALAEVELFRALDRLRLHRAIDPDRMIDLHKESYDLMSRLNVADISSRVLTRAAQPFPAPLRTLDAIHLSTALLLREDQGNSDLVLATHDHDLGRAARASGLQVVGV